MSSVINYKCPNCGAPLAFDAKTQGMRCEFCEGTFTMDEVRANQAAESKDASSSDMIYSDGKSSEILDEEGRLVGYSCPSCGAEMVADDKTAATECPYCGNKSIMQQAFSGMYKPDYVIPFKVEQSKASSALADFCSGKWLLPSDFKDSNRIKNISGVYVPFWLYDCDVKAEASYSAEKRHSRSIKRGGEDKHEVTIEKYKVERAGDMKFKRVPVDGSKTMDDTYMDAIAPYDLDKAVKYDSAYFAGYLASKYDESSKECRPRMEKQVKSSMESKLKETVEGYSSVNTDHCKVDIKVTDTKYAMLPVWMLSTKYDNQIYTFAMNGQNGRVVGSLPMDSGKYAKLVAVSTLIMFLIFQFILPFFADEEVGVTFLSRLISLVIALVVGFLIGGYHKGELSNAQLRSEADTYVTEGSFNLTKETDVFLNRRVEVQ